MKLAEALLQRKALRNELDTVHRRLLQMATVQEGETPAEPPPHLLATIRAGLDTLEDLVVRINRANNQARVGQRTMMEAIARRDKLTALAEKLQELAHEAVPSPRGWRSSRQEIKIVPTVDSTAIQREADLVTKEMRALDAEIQAVNWATEID